MKGVADSIALIQKTNHDLSMDRRGKILNAQLDKKYRKLGSAEIPKHIRCKKLGLELEMGFRKNLDIPRQNERTGTESDSPRPGKSCLPRQREDRADLAAKPTVTTLPSNKNQ